MSASEAVSLLKSKGYDAEFADKLVKVYYEGSPIHEEVGKILRDAGYMRSYATCGRYDLKEEK